MKGLFIVFIMLTSTLSIASDWTSKDRIELQALDVISQVPLASARQLAKVINNNIKEYNKVKNQISLYLKMKFKLQHCANIKKVSYNNFSILSKGFEKAANVLPKINISEDNFFKFQTNFLSYMNDVNQAIDNCKNIDKSAALIYSSVKKLEIASAILRNSLPELDFY